MCVFFWAHLECNLLNVGTKSFRQQRFCKNKTYILCRKICYVKSLERNGILCCTVWSNGILCCTVWSNGGGIAPSIGNWLDCPGLESQYGQTSSGAHPASCSISNRNSFPGVKRPGTSIQPRGYECVELCLHSPSAFMTRTGKILHQ